MEERIDLESGIYQIGDTVYIDAEEVEWEPAAQSRAASPPATNTAWNWGNGSYSGTFKFSARVWTNNRFTGYNKYNVRANVTGVPNTTTTGRFTVTLYNESNKLQTSYSATGGSMNMNYINLSLSQKYCFALSKATDGYYVTGNITVSHG